jgi:hypothetical protein
VGGRTAGVVSRRPSVRRRDVVIVTLLVVGLFSSVLLIIFGGGQGPTPADVDRDGATATIPFDEVSIAGLERWSGLDIPESAQGYLTARSGDSQLDVTFTMPPADEAAFVERSRLPEPRPGERYVLHTSPLWRLNPEADDDAETPDAGTGERTGRDQEPPERDGTEGDGTDPDGADPDLTAPAPPAGAEIRGTFDVFDGITRIVELVDEEPGVVRARIVLTPSG